MNEYLIDQMKSHPSMQPEDVIKFCFQAAYGAEHLLTDREAAREYFEKEYDNTEPADIPLYENISDTFCRANIAAWKYYGKAREELFELFVETAGGKSNNDEVFLQLLKEAVDTIAKVKANFTADELKAYIEKYLEEGIHAVHHSDIYRKTEQPAYRVVARI